MNEGLRLQSFMLLLERGCKSFFFLKEEMGVRKKFLDGHNVLKYRKI